MTAEVTTLLRLETVAETDGAKKLDTQLKQNQRTINSVTKDLKIQEAMLKNQGRSYQYVKAQIAGATDAELKQILAMEENIRKMKQQEAQMKGNNKTLRMMRGGFGQVGHQIQDVAVQLQGGTDAMIVFGQQGSQVVSLFGPQGAMIGAFLAVAAALATSFKGALADATKDLDDFVERTREQSAELGMLTDAQKAFDEAAKQTRIDKLTEDQAGFSEQVAKTERRVRILQDFIAAQVAVLSQYGEEAVANDQNLQSLNKELERLNTKLLEQRNSLDNTTGALNQLQHGTQDAVEADKKRIEAINEVVRAAAEEAAAIGKTAREQAIATAVAKNANETQIAAINHIYDLIDARTAEEKAVKDAEKAEKKRQDTVNGMISAAATQASTIGMTKRELDVYKATLQGASSQEIASLNALHDIIDARRELTAELKAQKQAQQDLKNEEIDAFISGINEIMGLIEDPTLAARTQAQERINIAEEMVNRGILSEQQYAEAVLKINQELHDKLGVIKGTSGQGPDRTIVDIGTDFDALLESQKTELDLFREHQQRKLDLITEHENAVNDVMIDYGQLRKQINDETNAYMEAGNLAALSAVIGSAQQQVNTLAGFFDQASGIGKAFFLVSQAMAASNAVIQGYATSAAIKTAYAGMAATAGPGAPAILAAGEAHAAAAIGMGFATAAAIAGQTIASFEGGGMTFNGVRSGGMDGKGGRLAMVHPNEKITDMEKGGHSDQPVNVNINIQAVDAKGIDELLVKRRGIITSLVQNSLNNTGARLG